MLLQVVLHSTNAIQHADTPSIQEILGVDRAHGLIYRQLLLRSTLVSEVGGQRYLLLTLHHSIYDAWSLTRLFSLLESAYERLATPPEWTKHMAGACSEVGFNQVVKSIMEQDQAKALDFWARFLKGVETKTLVPPEKKCEANTILRHKMMLPRTPESGTTGNNRAGAPPRVTHAVMTYAAVALTLHNQRQAQDTVLRLVSTSRITTAMPDIEDLVGPTVSSVPLRIQHSAGNLHEYLAHVQAQVRRVMPFEPALTRHPASTPKPSGLATVLRKSLFTHTIPTRSNLLPAWACGAASFRLSTMMTASPSLWTSRCRSRARPSRPLTSTSFSRAISSLSMMSAASSPSWWS
ncbi:putative hc-toxin synthetase [Ilyonectria robusta]